MKVNLILKRRLAGFSSVVCASAWANLKQVLVWQVISRVNLKDEDMVDSILSPAVGVNPQQEEELDQQEAATIDAHQRPNVLVASDNST